MNLSFAGCGFLGIYHVGVAVCFKKYAPHLLLEKISGASAGALAACCLLCDMPLGVLTSDFLRVVNEARSHSLQVFSPSFDIQTCLLEGLDKYLPANAHELVNGRLHISLTRWRDRKNVIVMQFDSRAELLQALLCACWIPCFSGFLPPKFQGERYMDGAFSDNLLVLDANTITVSPFCGESDICPRDESAQLFHLNLANTSIEISLQNLRRVRRILLPPKPEELSLMCQRGFDDALLFLHRNNLINCTRCLAVQSTFVVQETRHQSQDYDPECTECVEHRKDALVGNHMPETVRTVFQTYIEAANIGLANWIFKYRGVKLLQTLSLPATLPADFIYAKLTKLLLITNNLASIVGDTMERRQFQITILANYIYKSQEILPLRQHHRHAHDTNVLHSHWLRLLASTPCLHKRFMKLSNFITSQMSTFMQAKSSHAPKMPANISYQLSLAEKGVGGSTAAKPKRQHLLTHRPSKLDILFKENEKLTTVDQLLPDASPSASMFHNGSTESSGGDVDTFDHILEVTADQEAVYAYYYMDENNKVKVTEIFDMTDTEDPELQTIGERTINQQLQFDTSDWEATPTDFVYGAELDDMQSYRNKHRTTNNNNNNNNNHYWQNSYDIDSNDNDDNHQHRRNDPNELLDDDEYELFNNSLAFSDDTSTTHRNIANNLSYDDDASSQNDSSEPEADQMHMSETAAKALMRPHQLHFSY